MQKQNKKEMTRPANSMMRFFLIAAASVMMTSVPFSLDAAEKKYEWSLAGASGFGVERDYDPGNGELTVTVDEDTGDWSGVNLDCRSFQKNPADFPGWNKGFLVFEMKGGPDKNGKPVDVKRCQLYIGNRGKDGKITGTSTVPFVQFAEGKIIPADKFSVVRVPLRRLRWKKGDTSPVNIIVIQFSGNGKTAGGFTIRNVRFEIPEE